MNDGGRMLFGWGEQIIDDVCDLHWFLGVNLPKSVDASKSRNTPRSTAIPTYLFRNPMSILRVNDEGQVPRGIVSSFIDNMLHFDKRIHSKMIEVRNQGIYRDQWCPQVTCLGNANGSVYCKWRMSDGARITFTIYQQYSPLRRKDSQENGKVLKSRNIPWSTVFSSCLFKNYELVQREVGSEWRKTGVARTNVTIYR